MSKSISERLPKDFVQHIIGRNIDKGISTRFELSVTVYTQDQVDAIIETLKATKGLLEQ